MARIVVKKTKFASVRERAVVTDRRDDAPAVLDCPSIRRTKGLGMSETELEQVRVMLLEAPVECDVPRGVLEHQHHIGNPIAERT